MGFLTEYAAGNIKKPKEEDEEKGVLGTSLEYLLKGLNFINIGPSEETVKAALPKTPETFKTFMSSEQQKRVEDLNALAFETGMGSAAPIKYGRPLGKLLTKLTGKVPESAVTEKGNQLLTDLLKGGVITEEQVAAGAPKVGAVARKAVQKAMVGGTSEEEAVNELVRLYRNPEEAETAVDKISRLIRETVPQRAEQEALYSGVRSQQAARLEKLQKASSGEEGFKQQLSVLKGELPKAQYKAIRDNLSQKDINSLFRSVTEHPSLNVWEKLTAQKGLKNLLGDTGTRLPTEGELKILAEVFPPEFLSSVLSKRPIFQKVLQNTAEVLSIPRAMMASFDLSAPLRQGIILGVGHPKQAYYAFKDMFKFALSEKAYVDDLAAIKARPTYQAMKKANLAVDTDSAFLGQREEALMSKLPERIPGVGKVIGGSNRAYTGFLRRLRADSFDSMLKDAAGAGINTSDPKFLSNLGEYINTASGRGNLGALEKYAPALNATFFSPRLMTSRVQMLNPQFYMKLDPFVRKQALKSMLSFIGFGSTVVGLAKLGGADVTVNPTSADFGKIKLGNTRIDPWGGFQQYVRFIANMAAGQTISATTGTTRKVGEGYPELTRGSFVSSFLQSKEAPIPSFITSAIKGRNPMGQKFEWGPEIANKFIPMIMQDMADAVKEHGAVKGAAVALPGLFGAGVQTYTPTAEQSVKAANAIKQTVSRLQKSGKTEEVTALLQRNKELMRFGGSLKGIQSQINKLDKHIKYLKDNDAIPKNKRQLTLNLLEERKTNLEGRRDKAYEEMRSKK